MYHVYIYYNFQLIYSTFKCWNVKSVLVIFSSFRTGNGQAFPQNVIFRRSYLSYLSALAHDIRQQRPKSRKCEKRKETEDVSLKNKKTIGTFNLHFISLQTKVWPISKSC